MKSLLIGTLLVLAACSPDSQAPLVVSNVQLNKPLPGRAMSAGYLRISNNTASDIVITDVTSPNFERIEIHESTIEDGVARMRRIEALTLPAQSDTILEPGGLHLMLIKPLDLNSNAVLNFHAADTVLLSIDASFVPLS